MAERRTARRDEDETPRRRPDRHREPDDGPARQRRPRRERDSLSAAEAAQLGLRQIAELTGKEPEGITGVEPSEDGWLVGVEVVEDRRIPSSGDILATYETELDPSGEMLSYRRVRRYSRSRGDSGG